MKLEVNLVTPTFRWFIVSSCTIFILTILLLPGKSDENYDSSFSSFFDSFFTLSLGLWGIIEAVFHVFLFATLTILWQWTIAMYCNRGKSLLFAVMIAMVLGIGTEIFQYFVNRGSLMIDLLANFLGIALVAFMIGYRQSNR